LHFVSVEKLQKQNLNDQTITVKTNAEHDGVSIDLM